MKRLLLVLFSCISFMGILNAQERHEKSISFNGVDQYMTIPHSNDFNIGVNDSFTLSFWFNPARIIAKPNWQRIISKRDLTPKDGENKTGWELWGLGATWKEFLAINTPNKNANHDNSMSVWMLNRGSLNTWYHVAFVVDRNAGKMITYVNGQKTNDSSGKNLSGWTCDNTLPIHIGCGYRGGNEMFFFKGKLDDIRFYNKALSANEVVEDKDAVSIDENTDGLIAAYDFENFNEGDQAIQDITGRHNATLFNFPKPLGANSITQYQDAETNSGIVGRGENQQLSRFTIEIGRDITIENIKVALEGTTSLSDISKLGVYLSDSETHFDPRNPGVLIASSSSIDNETILNKVDNNIISKGKAYLWVVADIANNAVEGNNVSVKVKSIQVENEPNFETTESNVRSCDIVLQRTLLWAPGDNNSRSYRIPGIIRLTNGNLVASADKRKNGSNDLPNDIDVEVKISTDNGLTWGEPITVAQGTPTHGYGDAAMATDGTNIYMLLVGGNGLWHNDPEHSIQMYYTKSSDGGNTWDELTEITSVIKGTTYPYGGFFGSGNGIVTSTGKICFVAAMRIDGRHGGQMNNVLVYSDDNGQSWNVSPVARINGDESKVVELANGDILISSRNRASGANARTYVVSSDGGETWSTPERWTELMGNACNAGIARYTLTRNGEQKNRLLHTLPASSSRRNLKLFLSEDEGKTWPISKVICKGTAAYSEIVVLPNGEIGVISEENESIPYDIYFTKVSLNWLTDGAETYVKDDKSKCEKPEISPTGGEKIEFPFDITITTLTEDAKIYYTIDGSDPTESSTEYTGPFSLAEPATIKAIAIKGNFVNSDITEATYTQRTTWDKPTGTTASDRYVTHISTSGATQDIDFAADKAPSTLVVDLPIEIESVQGQSFTMHVQCTDQMKWTHAILFSDWNRNFSFDDSGEQVHMEGIDADGPKDPNHDLYKKGNESVRDFTINITVPDNAKVGKTTMRLQFNNAWHKKTEYGHSHSGMDDIMEGRVYDIVINIKEKPQVAKPIIENNSDQKYDSKVEINITCETEGAKIIYTLDGSDPVDNADALVYDINNPFKIDQTTTIKAMAVKDGMRNSEIVTKTFNVEIKTSIDDIYKSGLKVYPTIVNDMITIEYVKKCEARIYSINGSLLKVFIIDNGKNIIDCSDLPKGILVLNVDSKSVKLRK